jgi:hypothetical protein
MQSAIDREGTLQDDGSAVAVSGPINGWGVGEKKADFWVRIVQGNVVAEGGSKNLKFNREHDAWDVVAKVSGGKKLKKGPAFAEYWAKVERAPGTGPAIPVYWPIWPIRLK